MKNYRPTVFKFELAQCFALALYYTLVLPTQGQSLFQAYAAAPTAGETTSKGQSRINENSMAKYNAMIKLNEEFGRKINEHIERLQIYNNKQQVDSFDYLSRLNRYYMDINVCITNMMTLLNMYSLVTDNYIETECIIVNEITRNIVTMDNIEKAMKLLFTFTIKPKCQDRYIQEEFSSLLSRLPSLIEQQKELQRHFQQKILTLPTTK
ncbi:hypothetical protein DSUL_80068 [Desulfovibrionales bacterium]